MILKIRSANGELDEAVNYQVMSAKDLVGSVFTQGGWSNFLVWFLLHDLMISILQLTGCQMIFLIVITVSFV